jgi:hypothetical protein
MPADAPIILLRVSPMSMDALQSFQCRSVLEMAQRAECALRRLNAAKQQRCDALHALVPGKSTQTRRALLDIKRAVHNDRPVDIDVDESILPDVIARNETFALEMRTWMSEVKTYTSSLKLGDEAVRNDWERVRNGLARAWDDDLLQRGVLHAQPQLFHELNKQLKHPAGCSNRASQRTELSLLAYAYRAATKTSPFSTLTLTAVGQLADDADRFPVIELHERSSILVVSPILVSRFAARWLGRPEIGLHTPVRAPDLVETRNDQIVFLDGGASSGGQCAEVIRTLSDAPLATVVLRSLLAAPNRYSMATLRADLAERLDCPERVLDDALALLRACGLIRVQLDYESCRPDALDTLVEAIVPNDVETDNERREAEQVSALLRSLAGRPASEQAIGLGTVLASMTSLTDDTQQLRGGSMVFDRCSLSSPVALPAYALRSVLPVLEEVLGVLPLFNVELGAERLVQDFFRQRCIGDAQVPILRAFSEFSEFIEAGRRSADQDPFVAAANAHPATLAATVDRQVLIAELRSLVDGANARNVALPDGFFRRWAGRAQSFAPRRTGLSASFLGQFVDGAGPASPRFVLNSVVAGYGALSAAWARVEPACEAGLYLHAALRERLIALDPDGDVVEVAAAFDFGGQVRERITCRHLSYPGESSRVESHGRIDWQDLALVFDRRLDRITLAYASDGRSVLPVHLGTISSYHFPPFYRFLMCLGPAFTPTFSLIDLIEEELSDAERLVPRHYPRVTAGRVVISREAWCIPATDLPMVHSKPLSFADFLALRRWAREHDLPRVMFVTGAQTGDFLRDSVDPSAFRRARKPFFIDLDDYSSCLLFCRFTRRVGSTVRFVEMLPMPEQNPFRDTECAARVVECAVDIQEWVK